MYAGTDVTSQRKAICPTADFGRREWGGGGGIKNQFICLCRGFTAQSAQWSHVECGQFT